MGAPLLHGFNLDSFQPELPRDTVCYVGVPPGILLAQKAAPLKSRYT